MKDFTVSFNLADSEFMTALRLAVGAVCSAAEADVDVMEDMKVCVNESCLIVKSCGYENVEVRLSIEDGVCATVRGMGGTPRQCDNDFSLALVSALVSTCDIEKTDGAISKLTLIL